MQNSNSLRVRPNLAEKANQTPYSQANPVSYSEVSVLEVLKQRDNPDVRMIQAEEHFAR